MHVDVVKFISLKVGHLRYYIIHFAFDRPISIRLHIDSIDSMAFNLVMTLMDYNMAVFYHFQLGFLN